MAIPLNSLEVLKKQFFIPTLEEVTKALNDGLKKHFHEVQVEVVDCPDLTKSPFNLANSGIGGSPRLVEVGSPAYLLPLVDRSKVYDVRDISKIAEMESAFVIGAGAGPFNVIGTNCEGILNLNVNKNEVDQQSRIGKINLKDGSCLMEKLSNAVTEFGLLANLFLSEGKRGKVIKVHVIKRCGNSDFIASMRETLREFYGSDKVVGLGGTFLVKNGKVKTHIMPDFSKVPLNNDDDLNGWLNFFNMTSPLVAVGTFTTDPYDLDLRVQHFHLFGDHGEAGHYHIDTTPDIVEYIGYFNIGELVYRIDKPKIQQNYGKD